MNTGVFESVDEVTLSEAYTADTGIYIPIQQRSYVWAEKDLDALFQDIQAGMKHFADGGTHTATFVGAMTFFHDKTHAAFGRNAKGDLPAEVLSVMDGQQRLTTLMISVVLLHRYIHEKVEMCTNRWLIHAIAPDIFTSLKNIFEIDRGTGELRHYPRLIRAFDDCWSTDSESAKYQSPISEFIHRYGNSLRAAESFTFEVPTEKAISETKLFISKVKYIYGKINAICSGEDNEKHGLGNLSTDAVLSKNVAELITGKDTWPENAGLNLSDEKQAQLMRAFFLASYMLKKVTFASLVSHNHADALRIFISLNTTGQPLTAFEILKPAVIGFEGGDRNYHHLSSSAKQYFAIIDAYIGRIPDPEAQQKIAKDIVFNFVLAETGEKLQVTAKGLQNSLKDKFKEAIEDRRGTDYTKQGRGFMRLLSSFVRFREDFWDDAGAALASKLQGISKPKDIEEVQLCLKYLKASGHSICLSLLTRFYFDCPSPATKDSIDNLFGAIKATAAFFAIWSATRTGTESIDSYHRELFNDGVSDKSKPEVRLALKRPAGNKANLSEVKAAFRHILKTHDKGFKVKIHNCVDFQREARDIPLYGKKKIAATAKFLLLVAHHDAEPSSATPGCLSDARSGHQNMLYGAIWDDEPNYKTVEHIIPQSSARTAAAKRELHRLGNLTLLLADANRILSNWIWPPRKIVYKIISTVMQTDIKSRLEDEKKNLKKHNVTLTKKQKKILSEMSATPMVKALTHEEFLAEHIEQRSDNLCERAWKILYDKWLK